MTRGTVAWIFGAGVLVLLLGLVALRSRGGGRAAAERVGPLATVGDVGDGLADVSSESSATAAGARNVAAPGEGVPAHASDGTAEQPAQPATFRLRLVESDGKPVAGLGVALGDDLSVRPTAITDADGNAELAIPSGAHHTLHVALAAPERWSTRVSTARTIDGVATFRMPDVAWVEFVEHGLPAGARVWFGASETGWIRGSGERLFPWVVLAEEFAAPRASRLAVEAGRGDIEWGAGVVGVLDATGGALAPLSRGEIRTIDVRFAVTGPRLVGRIVDGEGSPLPNFEIDALFALHTADLDAIAQGPGHHPRDIARRSGPLATDGEGRFELRAASAWTGLRARLELRAVADTRLRARPFEGVIDGATIGLGDIALAEPVHSIRGRVVDVGGAPVPAVRVSTWVHERQGDYIGEIRSPGTVTDDDGEFAIPAFFEGEVAGVTVASAVHAPIRRELRAPADELFEVEPAFEVRGRVLLPEGLPSVELTLRRTQESARIVVPGHPPRAAYDRDVSTDDQGVFRFPDVPPESHALFVHLVGSVEPVAHVVDVVPHHVGDPSAPDHVIDLRASARPVRVRAKWRDGRTVDPFQLDVAAADPSGAPPTAWRRIYPDPSGEVVLAAALAPLELRCGAPGARSQVRRVDGNEAEFVLDEVPEIVIRFDPPPAVLPEAHKWRFLVTPAMDRGLWRPFELSPSGPDTWRVRLPRSGRWEIFANLISPRGTERRYFEDLPDCIFEIDLDSIPPVLVLEPPADLVPWAALVREALDAGGGD